MFARRKFLLFAFLILIGALGVLAFLWFHKAPVSVSGGLPLWVRVMPDVPSFLQNDPRWAANSLGPSDGTLGGEGCAVASAAMTLAARGIDVDPGRLNEFLTKTEGGYTPQGWIYWEKAAEFDPAFTEGLLPHYEDLPSYFLIDWNLLQGNPVIARMRYPNGITHFVVICGKEGFDYVIRDPGSGGVKGVYPFREVADSIEAIRFYRQAAR